MWAQPVRTGYEPNVAHLPAAYNQTSRIQVVLENYLNVCILRNDMWSHSRSHFLELLISSQTSLLLLHYLFIYKEQQFSSKHWQSQSQGCVPWCLADPVSVPKWPLVTLKNLSLSLCLFYVRTFDAPLSNGQRL